MVKHIPNSITSFNLVCGCLSIVASFAGNLEQAALWIGLAAVSDFFDGFIARALNAYSEIGKQLDSLADVVSFGVAPGFIFYQLGLIQSLPAWITLLAFAIPVFSAIRLAKFNIDTRQSDSFIGLPTPANALFISSMVFWQNQMPTLWTFLSEANYFWVLFPLVSAYALVAELPLLALKFKSWKWQGNEYRFVLIFSALICVLFFTFAGVALAIIFYILLSIIQQYQAKRKI